MFFEATKDEANVVKWCLDTYEKASGQTINFHKSNIIFNRNTSEGLRRQVRDFFNVSQNESFGKYLEIPSFVRSNKRYVLSFIKQKVKQHLGGWNKMLLSKVGKEIFLKECSPIYAYFCYEHILVTESFL